MVWLRTWGIRVAQGHGVRRAIVAVARRLAVVLHRMWIDGSEFRWSKDSTSVPAEKADDPLPNALTACPRTAAPPWEPMVRRLFAGGSRIRTVGPSREWKGGKV